MARAAKSKASKWVGRRLRRKEDPRLIQGISHYTDDLRLPGMLHCAFVRSPHANAKIESIETGAARSVEGVVAIITAQDLTDVNSVPCAGALPNLKVPPHPPLAKGHVRYVGEPVAAVVAEDFYAARDAAELVMVDYESLPAAVDMEKALEGGALVHPQFGTNLAFTHELKNGDIAGAFKRADLVVGERLVNQRLAPIALETRGVLAQYLAGEGTMTVWSSTQIPHLLKTQISLMLGMPETLVRVVTPEVGGGFGSKLNVYGEEAVVPWLAKKLGRPVKWAETRRENMAATIHGRDQINYVELALKRDGTILGLRALILADLGAYHQLLTPIIPTLTALLITGCYKIPAVDVEVVGVFTNKMSTDAYRGAGRPEATYIIERMVDVAAGALKMDPAEIRRKNFPKASQFPFNTSTGIIYDSGNYQETLKRALRMAGYDKLRARQKAGWKQGKHYGIGVSTYVEICAMGPSSAMPAGGWESGTVRVEPTGKITVLTGSSPHGQGQETSFAQIVADELGLEPGDVNVVHGDTAVVPYGIGTFGSRATAVGGTAMYFATQKVKTKMTTLAAHLMGVKPSQIVFANGRVSTKGGKKSLAFGEVVGAAYVAKNLPPGFEPGLEGTHFFEPSNFTFPFGAHVCSVEVDAETGEVKVDKYVAVDDCGNVINPMLVEGQIHGGIVQAIGQALYEEVLYNEDGQLVTGTLMDYAVPRAAQLPRFELARTVTPSPVNPMGVKGVGEAGTIGCTPCIVNAVCDALSPLGVHNLDMPLKAERVWRAMQGGRGKPSAEKIAPAKAAKKPQRAGAKKRRRA
ncbi:MAG TPA: xanthine dehydrogenase family protein molybdopterin-binding subunit [Terriglobales bacterium]|nr:xanthine dehydrogenase family protein molybdopterin-binding subunit [Terriglobales bacterium]